MADSFCTESVETADANAKVHIFSKKSMQFKYCAVIILVRCFAEFVQRMFAQFNQLHKPFH